MATNLRIYKPESSASFAFNRTQSDQNKDTVAPSPDKETYRQRLKNKDSTTRVAIFDAILSIVARLRNTTVSTVLRPYRPLDHGYHNVFLFTVLLIVFIEDARVVGPPSCSSARSACLVTDNPAEDDRSHRPIQTILGLEAARRPLRQQTPGPSGPPASCVQIASAARMLPRTVFAQRGTRIATPVARSATSPWPADCLRRPPVARTVDIASDRGTVVDKAVDTELAAEATRYVRASVSDHDDLPAVSVSSAAWHWPPPEMDSEAPTTVTSDVCPPAAPNSHFRPWIAPVVETAERPSASVTVTVCIRP